MLVFHPRDAAPASLQAMLDAGWTTTEVVTLSQLVAFLSFQIRVVAGLKVLAATVEAHDRHDPRTAAPCVPAVFTRDMLDWLPWLEPVAADRMTERHSPAWSTPPA